MVTKTIKNRARKNRAKPRDSTRQAVEAYAGDAYSLAQRSWAGVNALRKLINIEEKFLDVDQSMSALQTGNVYALSQLAQGTDVSNRVGDSIKVQHISINGRAAINASETAFAVSRIILFRDMENDGAAPAVLDVLAQSGTAVAPRSHFNWFNRKRFSILYDRLDYLMPVSGSPSGFTFCVDIPLVKHIYYRTSAASAAAGAEGQLFMLVISDEASNAVSVAISSRITFTDD